MPLTEWYLPVKKSIWKIFKECILLKQSFTKSYRCSATNNFSLCQNDEFAKTIIVYLDVPKFYSWNVSSKLWNRRKRGREIETGVFETDTIGRIYTVSLKQGDCFNLRLLLLSVPGPTMQAVSVSQFPHCLRNLFAVLLTQTNPSQPLELWMKFQSQLIEDYLQQLHISVDDAKNMALLSIRNTLHAIDGSDLQFYGLPVPTNVVVERFGQDYTKEVCYNIEHQHEIASGNRNKLTTEQLDIFHAIEGKINEKEGNENALKLRYQLDQPLSAIFA
ncbi:hypothetical protein RRG08_008901 [Elysia crispata]|uniref:Uncharacterized protein n=1 Tax=Elysia crispata TaxID=231223 RepID=A0AAE0ZWM6_9GAST|nr:hypothetical protein RRG08_008901 [Elysia crispata]